MIVAAHFEIVDERHEPFAQLLRALGDLAMVPERGGTSLYLGLRCRNVVEAERHTDAIVAELRLQPDLGLGLGEWKARANRSHLTLYWTGVELRGLLPN